MIIPTVGRNLYYKPESMEKAYEHDQPFMCFLCHVQPDGTINVLVLNEIGSPGMKEGVTLAQDREPLEGECYWMPYQVKTAQSQKEKEDAGT